jgi:hypothetical protein
MDYLVKFDKLLCPHYTLCVRDNLHIRWSHHIPNLIGFVMLCFGLVYGLRVWFPTLIQLCFLMQWLVPIQKNGDK